MTDKNRPTWAKELPDRDFELAMRGSFTTLAAAAYTGLSDGTLRRAVMSGDLEALKRGKGLRFQKRHLDAYAGFEEA